MKLTGGLENSEQVDLPLEEERGLKVLALVEDGLGAGAVLLPLVLPEPAAVAARARQRRPIRHHPSHQVADLPEGTPGGRKRNIRRRGIRRNRRSRG